MNTTMTSRERMLAALNCQQPDRVPCSFMLYNALRDRCQSFEEFIERQIDLGLDTVLQIPPRPPVYANDHYNLHGLPVSYDPRVTIEEWIEQRIGAPWPILVKEYHTPGGVLRSEVRQTADWPWHNHVPFLDDYLVPRSLEFPVTRPEHLEALRYLLVPSTAADIAAFQTEAQPLLDLARQRGLLIAGGWGVGADLAGWIHGLEGMILTTYDRPDFMADLLNLIGEWNRRRMAVVLEAGIDLFVKRAWYENCDFWTPASYRRFLLPITKADADLAHRAGAKFGLITSSSAMPLLDLFVEAGVDVLIGVDPREWNLAATKRKLNGKICLWGGVNGHLTVEQGTRAEVRAEVRTSLDVLAPGGGFILSPVDNVRENSWTALENVDALIEEWQHLA